VRRTDRLAPLAKRHTSQRNLMRVLVVFALLVSLVTMSAIAEAHHDGSYGDRDDGPQSASSYINRDTGTATENPDVNRDSSRANPDQYDRHLLGMAKNGALARVAHLASPSSPVNGFPMPVRACGARASAFVLPKP